MKLGIVKAKTSRGLPVVKSSKIQVKTNKMLAKAKSISLAERSKSVNQI